MEGPHLLVFGTQSSKVESSLMNWEVVGQTGNTTSKVFSKGSPELSKQIDSPDVDM